MAARQWWWSLSTSYSHWHLCLSHMKEFITPQFPAIGGPFRFLSLMFPGFWLLSPVRPDRSDLPFKLLPVRDLDDVGNFVVRSTHKSYPSVDSPGYGLSEIIGLWEVIFFKFIQNDDSPTNSVDPKMGAFGRLCQCQWVTRCMYYGLQGSWLYYLMISTNSKNRGSSGAVSDSSNPSIRIQNLTQISAYPALAAWHCFPSSKERVTFTIG
jgi:hypothetical protein